jgi:predicted PurR-regulated permease PerM
MNLLNNKLLDKGYKLAVLAALLILLLYYGGNIIFPILFAFFFSLALIGPARWLEHIGLPRFLASLLLILCSTAAFGALLTYISFEGYKLINAIDTDAALRKLSFIEDLGSWISRTFSVEIPDEKEVFSTLTRKLVNSSGTALKTGFSMLQSTFVFLSLVPVYAVLFLTYRGRVRTFLDSTLNKEGSKRSHAIIEEIATMIQSYLTGVFLVIVIVGALYAVSLSLLGVKFALLLALVTALLIVIPYIGSILGAILPAFVALLTMDPWWYSLVVVGIYILIQVLEGNILTPLIVGKNVDLNPLIIIVGMVVLGALGGLLALVIAVPLIASIKITLSHTKNLKALAGLMEENDGGEGVKD